MSLLPSQRAQTPPNPPRAASNYPTGFKISWLRQIRTRRPSQGTTTISTPIRSTARTGTVDGASLMTLSRPSPSLTSNTPEESRPMMTNGLLTTTNGILRMPLQTSMLHQLLRPAVARRRKSLTSISPRVSPISSTRSPSARKVTTLIPSQPYLPFLSNLAMAMVNSSRLMVATVLHSSRLTEATVLNSSNLMVAMEATSPTAAKATNPTAAMASL